MGFGVQCSIDVVLDTHLQQVVQVGFVAVHVGLGHGPENAWEGQPGGRLVQRVGRGGQDVGDAFGGQVSHLLHAAHKHHVVQA